MSIQHVNPTSMHSNPAFSQATLTPAGARLLFVGGQNGVGPDGQLVGDTLGAQTEQALRNLLTVLAEVGATQADVAKMTIHVVEGGDIAEGFGATQRVWGPYPTAITVMFVRGLNPGFLVEIDAVAALPG